jgi:RNA polymerase sigma factor (sigma-70 family)
MICDTFRLMDLESSFELIELAQGGDASALDRLLARYRPRLQRWATGRLPRYARSVADTDDLVQDTLVGTFKNIQTFEHRGEWALQAYLRRAVMNRLRNELDRFRSRPPIEPVSEDVVSRGLSPLEEAVGAEIFARYDAALEKLGEAEREAVIARLELGCTYQEIAVLLEKPTADAARMLVSRALAKLAESMSPA